MSFAEIFSNYTFLVVASASALLGVVSAVLGSFAVLRKQSLIGDAVSHSALPGIAAAFIVFQTKSLPVLLAGALISGIASVLLINLVTKRSKIKFDSALALVMSVFFGLGLVLLTYIQKIPNSNQAGLNKFIFGQASTMLISDAYMIFAACLFLTFIVALFWKEFKLVSFDPEFAATLGFPIKSIELALSLMLVAVTVLGIQTVGAVLMSAMLIAPAVAARQWTKKLWVMVVLASGFGAVSGVLGTIASAYFTKIPTGPSIIIFASVFALSSLFIAPKRGILSKIISRKKQKKLLGERKP